MHAPKDAAALAIRWAKLSEVPVFEPYKTYIGCFASTPGAADATPTAGVFGGTRGVLGTASRRALPARGIAWTKKFAGLMVRDCLCLS